jgi:hypothetical protein
MNDVVTTIEPAKAMNTVAQEDIRSLARSFLPVTPAEMKEGAEQMKKLKDEGRPFRF